MADIHPSRSQPESRGGKIGDPFAPFSSQVEQFVGLLDFVFDDPKSWFEAVIADVLSLPPEERFTTAVDVMESHLTEEFGGLDAVRSRVPALEEDRIQRFISQFLNRLISETLESIWYIRDGDTHLFVAVGYQAIRYGIDTIDQVDEENTRLVFSAYLAFLARLYELDSSDELTQDDRERLMRDVAWTIYVVERAVDGEAEFVDDPEGIDTAELQHRLLGYGAVLAYTRLGISVGRGAELAHQSRPAFEQLLAEHDITPRYGPESTADLFASDNSS